MTVWIAFENILTTREKLSLVIVAESKILLYSIFKWVLSVNNCWDIGSMAIVWPIPLFVYK